MVKSAPQTAHINSCLAISSAEINDKGEGWYQVFPHGKWMGHDGRGPYHIRNPEMVIALSKRENVEPHVDHEHETVLLPPPKRGPAKGWIKELKYDDKGMWARIEWTPATLKQIKNKEYRYLSPVFRHDEDSGEVLRLDHVSLTSTPNFDMQAIASALNPAVINTKPTPSEKKDTPKMKELLIAIASALSLASNSSQEVIMQEIANMVEERDGLKQTYASIAETLKLDKDADATAIVSAATAMASAAPAEDGNKPDSSKFVPISVYQEMATQLTALQKDIGDDKAERAVASAMKDGKISPASKGWALDYASKNAEGFAAFVKDAPKILQEGEIASQQPKKDKLGLTEEEQAIASQLGMTPEQFKGKEVTKEEEKKAA